MPELKFRKMLKCAQKPKEHLFCFLLSYLVNHLTVCKNSWAESCCLANAVRLSTWKHLLNFSSLSSECDVFKVWTMKGHEAMETPGRMVAPYLLSCKRVCVWVCVRSGSSCVRVSFAVTALLQVDGQQDVVFVSQWCCLTLYFILISMFFLPFYFLIYG